MNRYSRQLVLRAVLLESVLAGIAIVWAWLRRIPWQDTLAPDLSSCILGIVAGFLLVLMNYVLIEHGSRYNTFLRSIKCLMEDDVLPIFRHINTPAILMIALASGVAEELFFRGVLYTQFGIWLSSLLFGCAHIWKKNAITYGIYAAGMGVLLGILYRISGNLWVPICAHVVNNLVSLLYYVYDQPKPKQGF